ncbi:VOC family protein [Mycolicibacterium brumae]|nr:VOC family protein [Mycolicibacterium brumae]MCV7191281.1 VOC family protein [Mycolicibacterium brumae]RWA17815.1 hypothetical protein MBRU_18445 [Mycolicibacterium brumae DSM 44177]UWW09734.1 VOC family protein [Mycolicibacterium brumae]
MPNEFQYCQIAWVVNDLDAAIEKWRAMTGIGPFFVGRHVGAAFVGPKLRGQDTEIDISAAIAQAGPVQLEFIQQHDDRPSPYREMLAEGEEGLHHVCVFVDDVDAELARYAEQGYDTVLTATFGGQTPLAYVDTRALTGTMTELMSGEGMVKQMYARVAEIAADWDGVTDPVRDLSSLMG